MVYINRIHNKTHFLPVYTNTKTIIIIQSKGFYETRIGEKRANERVAQIRTIETVQDGKKFPSVLVAVPHSEREGERENCRVWWCFAMH